MPVVYKVVCTSKGALTSATTNGGLAAALMLEYKVGQVTKPKYGSIFAFKEYDRAKAFERQLGSLTHKTYEAQAGKVYEPSTRIPSVTQFLSDIVEFWKGKWEMARMGAPSGTVLCDWVMLNREV